MKKGSNLEYSIIICTYNRPDVVKHSLSNCLKQSVLASQIIVVDASPNFEEQKKQILPDLNIPDGLELIYLKAEKASAAAQRNQGILMASKVDVLFFLDDDSFIYKDCAEKILTLYKADKDKTIAGIQAELADKPPQMEGVEADKIEGKKRFYESKLVNKLERMLRFIFRYVFLMSDTQLFIPYYGKYLANGTVKLKGKEFCRLNLFQGCRMSFRYNHIRDNLFDSDLVKYSAGEDLDLSYRISQKGFLIECPNALVYHHTAAAGRLSRFSSSSMYAFNLALFVRKNSNKLSRDRRRYIILGLRRVIAEFCKDLLSLRLTFPQLRGLIRGTFFGLILLYKKELDKKLIKNHLAIY